MSRRTAAPQAAASTRCARRWPEPVDPCQAGRPRVIWLNCRRIEVERYRIAGAASVIHCIAGEDPGPVVEKTFPEDDRIPIGLDRWLVRRES